MINDKLILSHNEESLLIKAFRGDDRRELDVATEQEADHLEDLGLITWYDGWRLTYAGTLCAKYLTWWSVERGGLKHKEGEQPNDGI